MLLFFAFAEIHISSGKENWIDTISDESIFVMCVFVRGLDADPENTTRRRIIEFHWRAWTRAVLRKLSVSEPIGLLPQPPALHSMQICFN